MSIMDRIDRLKFAMISAAEKHGYNLQHPEVLAASRELDKLINKVMKLQARKLVS